MVSIHAPVRERRYAVTRESAHPSFNSRSREGATIQEPSLAKATSFNSRSREGATYTIGYGDYKDFVSIHAPVRERRFK